MSSDSADYYSDEWKTVKQKRRKRRNNTNVSSLIKTNETNLKSDRDERRTNNFNKINSQIRLLNSHEKAGNFTPSTINYTNRNLRNKNSKKYSSKANQSEKDKSNKCDEKSVDKNEILSSERVLKSMHIKDTKQNQPENIKLSTDVPDKNFGCSICQNKIKGAVLKCSRYTQTCEEKDKTEKCQNPNNETKECEIKQTELLKPGKNVTENEMASNEICEERFSATTSKGKFNNCLETDLRNKKTHYQIGENTTNLKEITQNSEANAIVDKVDDNIQQHSCSSTKTMETPGRDGIKGDYINNLKGVYETNARISLSHEEAARKIVENSNDLRTDTNARYQHNAHTSHLYKGRAEEENIEITQGTLTFANNVQNNVPFRYFCFPYCITQNPAQHNYIDHLMFQSQFDSNTTSETHNESFDNDGAVFGDMDCNKFPSSENSDRIHCSTLSSDVGDSENVRNSNPIYLNRVTYPNAEIKCVKCDPFILEFTYKGEAYYRQVDLSSIPYLWDYFPFNNWWNN